MTKFPSGTPTYFVEKILACTGCEDLPDSTLERLAEMIAPEVENGDWMIPEMVEQFRPKIHTIRVDAKNRWKPGNKIHFVINNRTKNYLQFAPVMTCVSVQDIEIIYPTEYVNDLIVIIDGRRLSRNEMYELAWNDGFSYLAQFDQYFMEGFKGKLIHWTNLKY
ncbi:hypothetical protein [Marinifilum flexuosum]|nr:hypothetical protein [Marinifilum flexuosum]